MGAISCATQTVPSRCRRRCTEKSYSERLRRGLDRCRGLGTRMGIKPLLQGPFWLFVLFFVEEPCFDVFFNVDRKQPECQA